MKIPLNLLTAIGLALGGIFGLFGTIVTDQHLRATAWGIDGTGLVVATSLLTLKYFRKGDDCVGAGFLVFAIGEGLILSGAGLPLAESGASFAAGTALWSAALFLTSFPRAFPLWTRAVGVIGGLLFGVTSARIFVGEPIIPTTSPLPFFAYPFLVATFCGWIWTVLRDDRLGAGGA
jgi:hypothetical protein